MEIGKRRLIVVGGCTGTGKTKLGVEIAQRYNGEVISADSMQVYKGLNIISNTVTVEEMDGVVHHCINFVSPGDQYDVRKFLKHALSITEDILGRGKLPVVVGGTSYWIEALLWDFTLSSPPAPCAPESNDSGSDAESSYEKLLILDPDTAARLHPNDSRRIARCLQICEQHGCTRSSLLDNQHSERELRGPLRWDSVLMFCVESNQAILDKRLDARVDAMVEVGLCDELNQFLDHEYEDSGLLNQIIGFKEFSEYLTLLRFDEQNMELRNGALQNGLDKMKTVTRRYARKQMRWINNRLADDSSSENFYFHRLDTSYPQEWDECISKRSIQIIDEFLNDSLAKSEFKSSERKLMLAKLCEICSVTCVGDEAFNSHMTSRKHRKRKAYLKSKNKLETEK